MKALPITAITLASLIACAALLSGCGSSEPPPSTAPDVMPSSAPSSGKSSAPVAAPSTVPEPR